MPAHALFLDWLVRATWQSALLIALVLLTQRLLRRRLSAGWRHALWWVVVARLALPFSLASSASLFNLLPRRAPAGEQNPVEAEAPAPDPAPPAADTPEAPASDPAPEPAGPPAPSEPAATAALQPPTPLPAPTVTPPSAGPAFAPAAAPSAASGDARLLLFDLWAAGAGLLAAVVLIQFRRAQRRVRGARPVDDPETRRVLAECCREMGLRRAPDLRETPQVASPALCGGRRACILLPAGFRQRFSARELRFVLLHELAHWKRADVALDWALTLLQLVHWFNPLVWLAFARMRADRELARDAMALAVAGEDARRSYGETILRLLEGFRASPSFSGGVGILEDRHRLRERLEYIARFRRPQRWSAWAGLLLAGLAVAGLTDARKDTQTAVAAASAQPDEAAAASAADAPRYVPLALEDFYVTRWESIPPATSWTAVPKGRQTLDGIPYDLGGLIELTGTGALGDAKVLPTRVSGIPVGRRAAFLHLIHGAAYAAPEGTPIARLVLHYADGQRRELVIRYGVHVRNWWREPGETSAQLSDPDSRVIWTGSSPETDRFRVTLRLFHTRLANPRPAAPIARLDLVSLLNRPSWVVLGITAQSGGASAPAPVAETAPPADWPPVQPPRTLTARVVDRPTGRPLAGAQVQLRLTLEQTEYRFGAQRTDAGGRVTLDLPATNFVGGVLLVRAPGHQPLEHAFSPPVGKDLGKLALERGVLIGGVVTDPDGQPVARAQVRVLGTRKDEVGQVVEFEIETVTTDAQGRWRCASVPPPRYLSFAVSHPDYYPAEFEQAPDDATDPEAPTARRLRARQARFVLKPGTVVAGVVKDPDGRPVAGAKVTVRFGMEQPPSRRTGRTDAKGHFRFVIPETGPARLRAWAEGFAPAEAPFDLKPGLEPLIVPLDPGRILRGRVVDEQGQPVPHARVALANPELADWHAETDEAGQFIWRGAPTDGFTLAVQKTGYEERRQPVAPDVKDSRVVIRLAKKIQLAGRVIDAETGKPIPDFQLLFGWESGPETMISWQPLGSAFQLTRSGEGRFQLQVSRNGPPGSFRLLAVAPGYSSQASSVLNPRETKPKTAELTFELPKTGALSGTVVNAAGQPVAGAQVALLGVGYLRLIDGVLRNSLAGLGNLSVLTQTDANGQFRLFPLVPGQRLAAAHPEQGFARFSAATLAQTNRVTLQPWGRVEGVLRIGKRLGTNQTVMLTPPFSPILSLLNYNFRAITDETGRFSFDEVPPGPQVLMRLFKQGPMGIFTYQFPLEVQPGKTTRVTYGGRGRPVIGRVALDDPNRKVEWSRGRHSLATRLPNPPPDVKTTEAYQAWTQLPEIRAAFARRRTYGLTWSPDGSFRVEDVLPGQYDLDLQFFGPGNDPQMEARYGMVNGPVIGTLHYEFEVPPIPGGRSDEPLDLGTLKVAWNQTSGAPGAGTAETGWRTLDGKPLDPAELLRECTVLALWSAARPLPDAATRLLDDLAQRHGKDRRFALYGLPTDADLEAARAVVAQAKLAWPQLTLPPEQRQALPARWGVASLPAAVLLRPDADPLRTEDFAALRRAVEAELAAAPPAGKPERFPVRDETSDPLRPLAGRCWTAAFAPDGRTLAVTGGWDNPAEPGELTLWDLRRRRPVWMRRQDSPFRAALFLPDGRRLAAADFAGRVRLFDPATGRLQRELPGHDDLVNSLACSADGRFLASGGFDDRARVIDLATGKVRTEVQLTDHIVCVALSPDAQWLAATVWQGGVYVWDADGAQRWESLATRTGRGRGIAEVVRFAPDGETLATGSADRSLLLWRARDGKLLRELKGHTRGIQNIQFTAGGKRMASSDATGEVRLWDPATGKLLGHWRAHERGCYGLAFSPGGGRLATANWDYTAKVWDVATHLPLAILDREALTMP